MAHRGGAVLPVVASRFLTPASETRRSSRRREVTDHLGYPRYVLVILGVWKVLGAGALVVPRFPRLKEWAYAGAVFNYTGAIASNLAVGDGAAAIAYPMIQLGLVAASWSLRPAGRRELLPVARTGDGLVTHGGRAAAPRES